MHHASDHTGKIPSPDAAETLILCSSFEVPYCDDDDEDWYTINDDPTNPMECITVRKAIVPQMPTQFHYQLLALAVPAVGVRIERPVGARQKCWTVPIICEGDPMTGAWSFANNTAASPVYLLAFRKAYLPASPPSILALRITIGW